MKTFRLLSGVSCAAVLACTGASLALDAAKATPVLVIDDEQVDLLGPRSIQDMFFLSFGGSGSTGGTAVEGGGGLTFSNVLDGVDFNLHGSVALEQPGGDVVAWGGLAAVFGPAQETDYQFRGRASGALGFDGVGVRYRGGVGAQISLTSSINAFLEVTASAPVGSPPDFGARFGIELYPFRMDELANIEVLKGPQGTLFGRNTRTYVGGKVAVIPGYAIPGVEAGVAYQPEGSPFDFGARIEHNRQLGGDWETSAGPEIGFTIAPNTRLFGDVMVGTIGGTFPINTLAGGVEQFIDPNLSLVIKGMARGHIGTISEFGVEGGLRYSFDGMGRSVMDNPFNIQIAGVTPYIGTSMSFIPGTNIIVPAVDGRLDFETSSGFKPGIQAELSYFYPYGYIGAFVDGRLAYPLTSMVDIFGTAGIGTINSGGPYNRYSVGLDAEIGHNWYISGSVFGQGALGHVTEGGIKFGVGLELEPEPEPQSDDPPPAGFGLFGLAGYI